MNPTDTTAVDISVRQFVYDHFIRHTRPPTMLAVADHLGLARQHVADAYERLAAARILVLDPDSRDLWMAMPFSAVPTDTLVASGGQEWWANCAWDALGIAAMIQRDVTITTACPDCDTPLVVPMPAALTVARSPMLHFAVPTARWWDDIGYT